MNQIIIIQADNISVSPHRGPSMASTPFTSPATSGDISCLRCRNPLLSSERHDHKHVHRKPLKFTSTPYTNMLEDSIEGLREADQSFLDPNITGEDFTTSMMKDNHISLSHVSFLQVPHSCINLEKDLELSGDFSKMFGSQMMYSDCPGSPMSLYFPENTGMSLAQELNQTGGRDSVCSMRSDDSGAYDIEDMTPSDNCSKIDDEEDLLMTESLDTNNNSSSFDIITPPTKTFHLNLTTKFNQHLTNIKKIEDDVGAKFTAVHRHLESTREYYHELVEKWFYKNVMMLDHEREQVNCDQQAQRESVETTMEEIRHSVKQMESDKDNHRIVYDLASRLDELETLVTSLQSTDIAFTTSQPTHLTTDHLGGILVQRTSPSVGVLPKRLFSFDSRQGESSDYMATGISMTSSGGVIVTDMGLDCVNVFNANGERRLNVNMTPGDCPTTAVQFGMCIAVACSNTVKLYEMVDGLYQSQQIGTTLNRPQGLATDHRGNLVVSGQRIDIPTIGIHDARTLLLNEIFTGDCKCDSVTEDVIGSELNESTNPVAVLFSKPWYVALDKCENLIVSDRDTHTIRIISRSGDLVEEIGSLGHMPGQFFHPAGLCVDRHGRIIVADSQNHRVQVVTPGESSVVLLSQEHDGIECPMDVALHSDGRLFILQSDGLVHVHQYC